MCVNKNPLNKRKILLNINYDVCSPSSFFLIASVKTNLNYILKLIVYCYISEERDALLNENDNWITSDSELI
jgi:hypothetical protein